MSDPTTPEAARSQESELATLQERIRAALAALKHDEDGDSVEGAISILTGEAITTPRTQ